MSECVWRVGTSYVTYAYLHGGPRFLASPVMHAREITFISVEKIARQVQVARALPHCLLTKHYKHDDFNAH